MPAGSVTGTGTATDNVGVTEVRVGCPRSRFRVVAAGQRHVGSAYAYRLASLSAPGGTSTNWSLSVNLPAGRFAFDATGA